MNEKVIRSRIDHYLVRNRHNTLDYTAQEALALLEQLQQQARWIRADIAYTEPKCLFCWKSLLNLPLKIGDPWVCQECQYNSWHTPSCLPKMQDYHRHMWALEAYWPDYCTHCYKTGIVTGNRAGREYPCPQCIYQSLCPGCKAPTFSLPVGQDWNPFDEPEPEEYLAFIKTHVCDQCGWSYSKDRGVFAVYECDCYERWQEEEKKREHQAQHVRLNFYYTPCTLCQAEQEAKEAETRAKPIEFLFAYLFDYPLGAAEIHCFTRGATTGEDLFAISLPYQPTKLWTERQVKDFLPFLKDEHQLHIEDATWLTPEEADEKKRALARGRQPRADYPIEWGKEEGK